MDDKLAAWKESCQIKKTHGTKKQVVPGSRKNKAPTDDGIEEKKVALVIKKHLHTRY